MRNKKKSHDLTRQNEVNVKKSQKHDANLQKNSTLYFQVGLIVCLLFTYGLLEMKFETKSNNIGQVFTNDIDDNGIYINPVIEVPVIDKPVIKNSVPKRLIDIIKTVPNDTPDVPTDEVVLDPPKPVDPIVNKKKATTVKPAPKTNKDFLVDFVEVVPVFPGCEKATTNEERKACMSKKIAKHIQRKFDGDVASDLGLEGNQKINVMFKIDQHGNVIDVRARSLHKALSDEAEEVIAKLPKMTPGKQHDKNVSVIYGIPINISVEN